MIRATRAAAALLALAGLIIAIPVLLIVTVANPWPAGGLGQVEMMSDSVILGVVAVLGWIFWAQMTLCVLWELPAAVRGVDAARIPVATSSQQHLVRILVHSILAIGVTTTVLAPGLSHRADASPAHAAARTADHSGVAAAAPTHAAADGRRRANATTTHGSPVAPAADAAHHSTPAPVVTVSRGDTLWGLAETHLGDGQRWRDIAALNRGHDMGAGQLFTSGRDIEPGWTLSLPTDATNLPIESAPRTGGKTPDPGASGSAVVQPGDTLSGIAEQELGNADRWPQLYRENREVVGADPDLILPGQILDLGLDHPGAEDDRAGTPQRADPDRGGEHTHDTTPTPPSTPTEPDTQPETQPEHAPPTSDAGSTGLPSNAPSPASPTGSAPSQPAPATVSTQNDHSDVTALRALLASAACLAAGALGLLAVNRRHQFRQRRPGRTIAATPPELGAVERAVVETGGAAQPDVEFLDRALRHAAATQRVAGNPLPPLEAAVLTQENLRLLFSAPAVGGAPEGWAATDDATSWTLPRSTILDADLMTQPAPYPALVSVGEDRDGRTWMLDLEAVGVLGVSGPADQVADVTRFLVAELAVNAWSEGSQILLADGFGAETVALNPSRVQQSDIDASIRRGISAVADADAWGENLDSELLDLRRDAEITDSTGPLVIVAPTGDVTELSGAVSHQRSQRRRSRVVVIRNNENPVIELSGDGMAYLRQFGVSVTPFSLPSDQADAMAALMRATSSPRDAPMPPARDGAPMNQYADAAGALRTEFTTPRQGAGDDTSSLLPQDDHTYLDTGATTTDDLTALAPTVPEQTRTQVEAIDHTLDRDLADWFDTTSARPKVHLLGPVDVTAIDGDRASIANVGGTIEFIVYLACQERGATKDRAAEALGWTGATVHNRARDARRFLGVRSDGQDWLPDAAKSESARLRGVAAYQLHPDVLVDADLFRHLRTRGQARGTAGIEDLATALTLVTSQPFDQLRRGGYGWLLEGDRLDHHMCAAIGDVAHLLVTHFLGIDDTAQARAAAHTAITADPNSEVARLDLAAITDAEGTASVDDVIREHVVDRVDADPTPRTEEILQQRRWLAS